MNDTNLVHWLMLEMVFGVGNDRLHEAVKAYESASELYYALHDPDNGILNEKERKMLRQVTRSQAEGILEYCYKNRIGIMTIDDEAYPEALKNIYNPPSVLFYKGDASLLHQEPLLTVVGARRASAYSLKVTEYFCRSLARRNVTIVSGGAVGIDATAHWAALHEGKPTISVMGCGVDYDYPRENRELRERMVQKGLLLSEYFPGTQPYPSHFPVRNRILAGISEGTLVVEASAKSGSLITANLACDSNRQVFCVPPADIFDVRYKGVVRLLRDGAIQVFDELDIVQELYQPYPHRLIHYDETESSATIDSQVLSPAEEAPKKKRKPAAASTPAPEKTVSEAPDAESDTPSKEKAFVIPEEATADQRSILELLQKGGQNVNSICYLLKMPFEQVSMLLMEMEMNDWIVNTERDIFTLRQETC